ncbi:AI-2E family transporter [Scytonema hofmannii FACHB-248]|uniref:AI-2E family transporter n=1 Tax=Scytonema hofmannii FACHB-248 TaxID=1842502 RepID=A0ABR8GYD7_9CYAN|nr:MULTISPECIES: AI-2E family transporter [Nostocales]MBD2608537.1 AI-2E family transporter [Scytonema hofmannii FACHB-248]
MTVSFNQLLKWLVITLLFPLIFLNGWLLFRFFQYFQPLVTTFVLATLLGFILNYPVSILEERGVKRGYAIALVFFSSIIILAALGVILVPIVLEQFHEMVQQLPQWIDYNKQKLDILNDWAINHSLKVNFRQIFTQITDQLPSEFEFIGDKIFSAILDAIDSISETLITIVLTFYLLADGKRIWDGIFKKLPLSFGQKVRESIQENFKNYLIGQVALALLMGVSLTIVFLILNVPFALLFGLGVGILSLIPFGDVVSLAVIILIIASHDFWLAVKVFAASVVVDQLIDQAIAPRLLGSFTGLRPIWVLVSLLVGTYIGGLLGLLIAVPVAGFIKDAINNFASMADYSDNVDGKEKSLLNVSE